MDVDLDVDDVPQQPGDHDKWGSGVHPCIEHEQHQEEPRPNPSEVYQTMIYKGKLKVCFSQTVMNECEVGMECVGVGKFK
jgi:hypothetical protein